VDLLEVVVNGLAISAVGTILAWLSHGRFRAIEAGIHRLEDHLHREVDRLDNRIDGLQSSIEGLRSDLTAVALAVGAHPRSPQGGTHR
jgi:hypothetical protein